MALPVIANVLRIAVEGRCSNGQQWVNVLHAQKEATASYTAAADALNVLLDVLYGATGIFQYVTNNAVLDRYRMTPLDGVSASLVYPQGNAGSGVDESLPPATTFVTSHRTAKRGPRYRGRTYLPQMTRGVLADDGSTSAAIAAAIDADWAAYNGAFAADVSLFAPVVASYKFATAEPIVFSITNTEADTQRRRRLTS